nr:hypothetical protein [Mesorhizobium sp.]
MVIGVGIVWLVRGA